MLNSWLAAYAAATGIILLWDLVIAGRIIQNRRGSPLFLGVTALAGLLVVPGVIIAVAAGSMLGGRVVHVVEWIWPVALAAAVVQSAVALRRGAVAPSLGVLLTSMNALLFAAAVSHLVADRMPDASPPALVLGAAHANALGFVFGRAALSSAFALQVPVIAPSFPARYRVGRPLRLLLGLWAAVTVALVLVEVPRATHALATFAPFARERLQERPRHDLAIGLRVLPALTSAPPAIALRDDLAVADSLEAGVLAVLIAPRGATGRVLDSLARGLQGVRRNRALLVATLGYGDGDRAAYARDAGAYRRARLVAVELMARRLRPDILFPALDPYLAGARTLGDVPPRWWTAYLREAAGAVRRIDPRIRVGVAASAWTPPDSELFAWAAAASTPLDVLGLTFQPSYGGGAALLARLHVAERWMRGLRKQHVVFARGAYPWIFGERSHEWSLWGTLAWATRQPRVEAFIVDGAADYEARAGLRAPGGRLRTALRRVSAAQRALGAER